MAAYGQRNVSEERAPARDDAYTVMLIISLLAMIGACVMLFYELKRYPSIRPDTKYTSPPSAPPGGFPPLEDRPTVPPAPADGVPPAGGAPESKDGAPAPTPPPMNP
jgi:hypothetical protein